VHFDAWGQRNSRFGKRLIYGGVVISLARALSFNGLANAQLVLAINGGRHVNPTFAGDTLYAWSEVLAKEDLGDVGALRQ
jgi:2-methylfumaryl-CoA hydratase